MQKKIIVVCQNQIRIKCSVGKAVSIAATDW
jgi:hypothetical protein